MHIITDVDDNSIASKAGIRKQDKLISVNGAAIKDVFDYRYALLNKKIKLITETENGVQTENTIKKREYEDIGLHFETALMDNPRSCKNKCLFCFIDQNPKGLRKSLYFKDDDPRLSFLCGNYVTLSNVTDNELDRLLFYHLSPFNISVHAADLSVRTALLNNPKAGDILKKIEKIAAAGVFMNFQIVLVNGINDGECLYQTIKELARFIPKAESLSVVPAGLTAHRKGLYNIRPFNKIEANAVINTVEAMQTAFLKEFGTRFVYAADEFYILANKKIPLSKAYEEFYQLENGVGMAALMLKSVKKQVKTVALKSTQPKKVSVVTGLAAYPLIEECVSIIKTAFPFLNLRTHKVQNRFFGGGVTVSGLLTGADIMEGLKNEDLGDIILLPENTLNSDNTMFLDDTTPLELAKSLQKTVIVSSGSGFVSAALNAEGLCFHP